VIARQAFDEGQENEIKDYAFWRQFEEKSSVIPGCPAELDTYNSTT